MFSWEQEKKARIGKCRCINPSVVKFKINALRDTKACSITKIPSNFSGRGSRLLSKEGNAHAVLTLKMQHLKRKFAKNEKFTSSRSSRSKKRFGGEQQRRGDRNRVLQSRLEKPEHFHDGEGVHPDARKTRSAIKNNPFYRCWEGEGRRLNPGRRVARPPRPGPLRSPTCACKRH